MDEAAVIHARLLNDFEKKSATNVILLLIFNVICLKLHFLQVKSVSLIPINRSTDIIRLFIDFQFLYIPYIFFVDS